MVNSTIVCQFVAVIPMSYLVYFNFFLCNLTPLLIIAVLYGYIFWTIRGSLREKPGNGVQTKSYNYLKKEKQLAVSLSLVFALFALSWIPLHIMNCMVYFGITAVPVTAFHVGISLSHSNSAVNPILYAFRIRKIRTAYVRIWKRYFECGEKNLVSPASQTTDNNLSSNMWRQMFHFSDDTDAFYIIKCFHTPKKNLSLIEFILSTVVHEIVLD